MRIIAGRFRGVPLEVPPGTTTRPMTDRVKESLFNILGHRFGTLAALPQFDVLDLFAGSGSLGLECMSRGARSCLFVECDRRSLRALRHNLARVGLTGVCRVTSENAWTMRIRLADGGFGLIFVDPPYRDVADPIAVLDLLERLAPALLPDGLMVFRHDVGTSFPEHALRALSCVDERIFGRTRLLLLGRARSCDPKPPREAPGGQP